MLAEGYLELADELEYLGLVLLGEILVDVHLAYSLAEYAVGHAHGAFPAGFLFSYTAHLSAEEVK